MAAKRAAAGLKDPLDSRLDGISRTHTSKIDRSAMRAACGEQSHCGADHEPTSAFSALLEAGPAGCGDGLE